MAVISFNLLGICRGIVLIHFPRGWAMTYIGKVLVCKSCLRGGAFAN